MRNKIKYKKGEIGQVEIVDDFLPKPENLVLKEDTVKITIVLSKRSVEFFKKHAELNHVPYQNMIRSLLDTYAENYTN